MKKFKRSVIIDANRYQSAVLLPFLAACIVAAVCASLLAFADNPLLKGSGHFRKLLEGPVGAAVLLKIGLALVITVLFLGLIYWACYVTNRVLGAHNRVLNQLDEIIFNNRKGPLHVREGDEFFEELLERVNILVEPDKKARGDRIDRLLQKKFGNAISPLKK
jgi:hypothetical protein